MTLDRAVAEHVFESLSEAIGPNRTACSLFETAQGRWTLTVHFADLAELAAIRALVEDAAGADTANALIFDTVAETDWVTASLTGLAPVPAGRFVVHGAHDRARVPPNHIGIEIEAALAFGTGHHGTTRGCLLALDRMVKARRPRRILDIGTGTGVLAIAAAKAFRRPVLASDIDMRAITMARTNARLNHTGPLVETVLAFGLEHKRFQQRAPFDLVLANILLGPLQRLARPIVGVLAPRGQVVLSGLLQAHANAALAAYRLQGLILERHILLDGWVTLVLRRGL
ncbi:MAG: 50S ribosomal protein L11 methyltransferase [Rhizobiales bacterium]|nr:50S ribosomal protein L11 methyltransferase [Hyphomicrobiales bacterium]